MSAEHVPTKLETLQHQGQERRYRVYAPRGVGRDAPAPLVFVLHGGGGTSELALDVLKWRETADARRFLVVAPDALAKAPSAPAGFLKNPQFWNSAARISPAHLQIDDLGFIAEVLHRVASAYRIDADRVYASGFSNGASMAMRAGMERCDLFAAVGAVAGNLWIEPPARSRPVSLLFIAGALDPMVPYAGGEVTTLWGKRVEMPPMEQSISRWASWLGIHGPPQRSTPREQVRLDRYGPTPDGAEIEFYCVQDMGHVWPGGVEFLNPRISGPMSRRIDATELIWDFFARHPRRA